MSDHFNVIVVAWMFLILIGAWVAINALIDLGAKRLWRWLTTRWSGHTPAPQRVIRQTREPR